MTNDEYRQPSRRQPNQNHQVHQYQQAYQQGDQARRSAQQQQASHSQRNDYSQRNAQMRDSRQAQRNGYANQARQASRQSSAYSRNDARYTNRGQYPAQQRPANQAQYDERMRYEYANQYNADPMRQEAMRYNDPARYSSAAAGGYNSLYDPRGHATAKKKTKAPLIVAIVLAVALAVAAIWVFVIPHPFDVTVNGKEVTMNPGSTVNTLVEEGYARPIAGDLMAVDGSLITAGQGEPFAASINGKAVSGDTKLAKDMVVVIDNGGNITEDFTTTEEVVPFETVNDDMSFEAYWTGSIHQMSDGQDGLRTVKTGAISGKTVSEDTKPMVPGGYHNYTVQTDEKVIALTFDDGPWPETTDQILDILQENGAKATFFTIGNQIQPYAASVKRAADMGCEVCTHSWDHADGSGQGVDLTLMSAQEQIDEITQGYAAIAAVLGKEPTHIMRAPGGNFHDDIITTLWPYVDAEIGWDVDTEDWAKPGSDAIAARILSVQPGQVILMHDGGGDREQTVAALRQALPQLIAQGYKCVTVSELLTYNKA